MDYQLKSISRAGIPEALAKVELYRYLNEPEESESICRDILAVEPKQQLALRLLGLSITDQFLGGVGDRYREVEEIFQKLSDSYERFYYTGILYERRAKAQALGDLADNQPIRPSFSGCGQKRPLPRDAPL